MQLDQQLLMLNQQQKMLMFQKMLRW